MTGGSDPDAGVTLVASHHVRPGKESEFERTTKDFMAAEATFPGYRGTEVIRPVPGVQEEWITLIRFDDQEHMHAWLASDQRQVLLDRLTSSVARLDVQEIGGSFGSWFARDEDGGRPSPNWKQAMAVLLMLYPAVMLISKYLSPLLTDAGLPLYAAIFVGNVVSVAALTWILMPLATRVLKAWLAPQASPGTTAKGALALVVAYALLLAVFAVVPA